MTDPEQANIWLRPEKPTRGKAPAYSRADIAAAAVRVADGEGLAAVSMRRVAREVGAGTMSLYRYVQNKDELYALMVDSLFAGGDGDADFPRDWSGALRAVATGSRQLVLAHPWFPVAGAGVRTPGPNMLRGMEGVLSILDLPGLKIDEQFQILMTVMTFAMGYAQNELAERAAGIQPGNVSDTTGPAEREYIARMLDSGDFPYLARMVADAETPHLDSDGQFHGMLGWLIDGIGAGVRDRTGQER